MPSVAPQPVPTPSPASQALIPMSYSPPFGLSTTPPFAIPPTARQTSNTVMARPPSIPQGMNVFPPVVPAYSPEAYNRYSTSPTSFQTGALARALTNTAIRIIGSSASSAATAIVRAASRRRPTIVRITEVDAAEDELLHKVEDSARKAFVLFDLAEQRLLIWQQLGRSLPAHPHGTGSTPPFTADGSRRKSSGSSANSEVNNLLRQQETCAGEAVMLFAKAMGFITRATGWIKEYVDGCRGYSEGPLSFENINPSPELVESESRGLSSHNVPLYLALRNSTQRNSYFTLFMPTYILLLGHSPPSSSLLLSSPLYSPYLIPIPSTLLSAFYVPLLHVSLHGLSEIHAIQLSCAKIQSPAGSDSASTNASKRSSGPRSDVLIRCPLSTSWFMIEQGSS